MISELSLRTRSTILLCEEKKLWKLKRPFTNISNFTWKDSEKNNLDQKCILKQLLQIAAWKYNTWRWLSNAVIFVLLYFYRKIKQHVCPFFSLLCVSPNTTDITGQKDSQYLFSQSLCFKALSLLVMCNNMSKQCFPPSRSSHDIKRDRFTYKWPNIIKGPLCCLQEQQGGS